jgi:hypothetical protein
VIASRLLSRKKLLTTVLIFSSSFLGMQSSHADYYPSGIQQNVPEQTLINNGWTLFYSETFATPISENVSELIPTGKYVIFAGRQANSSTLTLAAAGLTSAVFRETPVNTPQLVNGTYWYFTKLPAPQSTNVGSIGFAPTAEIRQNETDLSNVNDPLRMSCFTNFEFGGCWRLGTQLNLSRSTNLLQEVWTRDTDPVVLQALRQTTNLSFDQSQYGSDTLSDPDGQLRKTLDSINAKYGNLLN